MIKCPHCKKYLSATDLCEGLIISVKANKPEDEEKAKKAEKVIDWILRQSANEILNGKSINKI